MGFLRLYSPWRVWKVFRFLATIFLLIKKRDSFLWITPLSPRALHGVILDLGASFIKLAQVLATRSDFFDESYLEPLRTLHDDIPPMDHEAFRRVFERSFGGSDPFLEFASKPLASASIGQVHRARLKSGEQVAVKLLREGIGARVQADIRIITFFNLLFRPLFSPYTKHSVESVLLEFSSMILKEVNLAQERYHLELFWEVYRESGVLFPLPFADYCTSEALVMSFHEGVRFDDKEGLLALGVDFGSLMEKLVGFYVEQMLITGLFHADPHPGNLLVDASGNLIFLDFGMVKKISTPTRIAIIELVKAAHERDFEHYILACKKLGIIAQEAPSGEMEEFASRMFAIFDNTSLDSASMQKLAFEVLESMRDMPFKLPQEAIYILRVSAIIEGLGTRYIENFNGIKDILPILQKNLSRALGMREGWLEGIWSEAKSLPMSLKHLKNILAKADEGELRVRIAQGDAEALAWRLRGYIRGVLPGILSLLGAFFLLGAGFREEAFWLFGAGIVWLFYKV